ncbi:hypothetical protein ACFWU5_22980 [Nocardia sp. NPDC058640]|uniref:hypothetical protein n=1 Tax=Nocardia sp. NPDC058640 TaxID=3346571 RepID=UPI003656DDAF
MTEVQGAAPANEKRGAGAILLALTQIVVGALTGAFTALIGYLHIVIAVREGLGVAGPDTEPIRYWATWILTYALVLVGLRLAYRLQAIRPFVVTMAMVFVLLATPYTMIAIGIEGGGFAT